MQNTAQAIELLAAATQEYAPSRLGDGALRLDGLELFVDVREVQSMNAGVMCAFIAEVNAASQGRGKGINITCVGRAGDMTSAVADAVAQWVAGVLPVLAQWRGKHTCLSSAATMETQAGSFELLAGPVVAHGFAQEPPTVSLSSLLLDVLRNERPAQRLHWLEMFACKLNDGSVDATCRLDNRDWGPGRQMLLDVASAWPTVPEVMQSCRQFALLVPTTGERREIAVPSFWSRLLGDWMGRLRGAAVPPPPASFGERDHNPVVVASIMGEPKGLLGKAAAQEEAQADYEAFCADFCLRPGTRFMDFLEAQGVTRLKRWLHWTTPEPEPKAFIRLMLELTRHGRQLGDQPGISMLLEGRWSQGGGPSSASREALSVLA